MEIDKVFDNSYRQMARGLDLDRLAYKQERWTKGQNHLLATLRQFMDSQDRVAHDRALDRIARLWQKSGDASLRGSVAQVLGTTPAEAEVVL